ncbi:MAG: CDC27 family protein [Myxococcales bacterium]|jgi:tetratricopeptide (TPR) repeat protein|nr:CDC27 family protein [Myxococcales bacterium]
MALGALSQHQEAIIEWEAARKLNPARSDATYNLGQAYYNLGQYQPALAEFQAAYAADSTDHAALRKQIQCLYALGRYDEGEAARAVFRQSWAETSEPRFHLINEYVFDQFDGDKIRVHAIETMRPRDPSMYAVLTFAAVDLADQPLPLSVG